MVAITKQEIQTCNKIFKEYQDLCEALKVKATLEGFNGYLDHHAKKEEE